MFALKYHVSLRPSPCLRIHTQLLGEVRQPDLDARNELRDPLARDLVLPAARPVVHSFVVDADIRGRARGAEPVDADPRTYFLVRPGVVVGPVVQFLVDPGEQRDRAVGERVAEGLGFGGLFGAVAGAVGEKPGRAGNAGALAGVVGGQGVLRGQERVGGPGRTGPVVHIGVCGEAVVGVEEGQGARDVQAPVACSCGKGIWLAWAQAGPRRGK